MARPFLSADAKRALSEAVHAVESACGAELMIAVRKRSGSYLDGALAGAIGGGLAVLAFLLFSPWSFRLEYFLIDPAIFGLLSGVAASRSTVLLRLLTSRHSRHLRVAMAARAAFVDKHVHRTSRRTGILLYISLLEREAELVADVGLDAAVATPAWQGAVAGIQEAVGRGEDGVAVAEKVRALAPILASTCARVADQVNELEDEVSE
jgi:putative membrane protein